MTSADIPLSKPEFPYQRVFRTNLAETFILPNLLSAFRPCIPFHPESYNFTILRRFIDFIFAKLRIFRKRDIQRGRKREREKRKWFQSYGDTRRWESINFLLEATDFIRETDGGNRANVEQPVKRWMHLARAIVGWKKSRFSGSEARSKGVGAGG